MMYQNMCVVNAKTLTIGDGEHESYGTVDFCPTPVQAARNFGVAFYEAAQAALFVVVNLFKTENALTMNGPMEFYSY